MNIIGMHIVMRYLVSNMAVCFQTLTFDLYAEIFMYFHHPALCTKLSGILSKLSYRKTWLQIMAREWRCVI